MKTYDRNRNAIATDGCEGRFCPLDLIRLGFH